MTGREQVRGRGIAAGLKARLDLVAGQHNAIDGVTGLPNRDAFHHILAQIFADPARSGVALLRISVDNVATLRQEEGPATADGLVAAVAGRLKRTVREGDVPAKLKEAEFALILAADDVAEAACAAQRVLDRLRENYEIGGRLMALTVSIGIAYAAPEAGSAETLLSRAEIALERARTTGRGEWRIFKPGNGTDPDTQRAMLVDLHRALDQGEITLGFQPVVEPDGFKLAQADAAPRWCHPRIGIIESSDFIPVLNDRAVADLLAAWTIRSVCRVAADARHALRMVVPLLSLTVPDEGLLAVVRDAMAETGLLPGRLTVAIDEATLRNADAATLATVEALRGLGVGVLLDNLSSLSTDLGWLRALPIDAIRTSPTLLEDLENDITAFVRFQALTGLAHSLGRAVIARGVRTDEEVDALRRFGFSAIEGPLLGGPFTAVELSAYARTGTPIARRPAGERA